MRACVLLVVLLLFVVVVVLLLLLLLLHLRYHQSVKSVQFFLLELVYSFIEYLIC